MSLVWDARDVEQKEAEEEEDRPFLVMSTIYITNILKPVYLVERLVQNLKSNVVLWRIALVDTS